MSHEYPGVNYALRVYPDSTPVYITDAHDDCLGHLSQLLPVREVFMMVLMDRLSDKVDWHKKVFDEEIVAKWRKEALEHPEDKLFSQVVEGKSGDKVPMPRAHIISEAAFDYCIKELRAKAAHFERTGLIPTLDSVGNSIVKSDTVVTPELQKELHAAFDQLRADQASDVDWHPRSDEKVQNLVHPSMYPLIYGKSNFFQEEVVGVSDAIELWAGKGKPVYVVGIDGLPGSATAVSSDLWSDEYQWLPANLAFQEDGTVKFTSYINNLHPTKYPSIYRTIEKLVDTVIPAWDQFLATHQCRPHVVSAPGRQISRFSLPQSGSDLDDALWEPFNAEVLAQNDYELTESEWEDIRYEREYDLKNGRAGTDTEKLQDGENDEEGDDVRELKWRHVRDPVLPEADDDEELFVKMATIELTPEEPDFPMGSWHVEGQANERICATALFYLDSENVTPSHLSFRMSTSNEQDDLQNITGQDEYHWLERVYGTQLTNTRDGSGTCLQHYGSVETRQGRLLAFPNVFQHRVSPFKLQDPTKPGHRRFMALWLIDPLQRIVSTGNVPPQRQDWWEEAVFGKGADANTGNMPPDILELLAEHDLSKKLQKQDGGQTAGRKLPTEIVEMVRKNGIGPQGLFTAEEAKLHREKLMNIRSRNAENGEKTWEFHEYYFCEH
ncbi:hypothetical protein V493_00997 [Pseudogymnoascus sp. VKM F-4281 (FW-2241)]|nr:hypothetical protein V493_00997 [Pseudogymnoascus sp. VKM F-4281 (FW-2241)]